jgi:glycosyltransferase involved in cell wall biosynthesis
MKKMELSIVIPCLNEEKTLPLVIEKSLTSIRRLGIDGEVLVSDNGSTDKSVEVSKLAGARVVHCQKRGYGNALSFGFAEAKGKYVIMGDADDSYDFNEIEDFVEFLRKGYDIVMGTRIGGKIEKGAMPFLHRYLGTPVLTFLINLFFGTRITDCNCGMRGLSKKALEKMNLVSDGMEFASEMIIKAGMLHLKIKEIPITLHVDKRERAPHLHTWRDGWRHLKFILIYAPNVIFVIPGALLFLTGTLIMLLQINGPFVLGNLYMGIHSMILGLTLAIFGVLIFQMGLIAKLFSKRFNSFYRNDFIVRLLNRSSIEKGLLWGGLLFSIGLVIDFYLLLKWAEHSFRDIFMPEVAIFGIYFIFIGMFFVSFSFLRVILHDHGEI